MKFLTKEVKPGILVVSEKTYLLALKTKRGILTNQEEVNAVLKENRVPVVAQIEITERCNFNCYYCYAKSLREKKELPTEQIKKILDILYEKNIVFLEFTGGEPFAHNDIAEIIKYANEKQFIMSFITNGSLLTEEIVQVLSEGKVRRIQISMLAPTMEKCDALTGVAGSFQGIKSAVDLLKKYNIPFVVMSTITNQNIDMVDEFELAKEYLGGGDCIHS